MNQSTIIDLTVQAMFLVLYLSMPTILLATIIGLLVSLMQALTQIQEQTLGFAVKLITAVLVLVFTAQWMGAELINFARYLFESFPTIVS